MGCGKLLSGCGKRLLGDCGTGDLFEVDSGIISGMMVSSGGRCCGWGRGGVQQGTWEEWWWENEKMEKFWKYDSGRNRCNMIPS